MQGYPQGQPPHPQPTPAHPGTRPPAQPQQATVPPADPNRADPRPQPEPALPGTPASGRPDTTGKPSDPAVTPDATSTARDTASTPEATSTSDTSSAPTTGPTRDSDPTPKQDHTPERTDDTASNKPDSTRDADTSEPASDPTPAKSDPTEPESTSDQDPTRDTPPQDDPTRGDAPQDASTRDRPTQDDPAQSDPSDDHPTQDDPRQDDPTQDGPSSDGPTRDHTDSDDPTRERPTQDDPAQERPNQDAPAEDDASQDRRTQDRPTQDDATQDRRTQDDPTQDDPAQDDPAQDDPAQDDPAQDRPAEDDVDSTPDDSPDADQRPDESFLKDPNYRTDDPAHYRRMRETLINSVVRDNGELRHDQIHREALNARDRNPDYAHMSDLGAVAVRTYTHNEGFQEVNRALRTGEDLDKHLDYARTLVSGLNELRPHVGPTVRFMGVGEGKAGARLLADQFPEGEVYVEPGFMSSSKVTDTHRKALTDSAPVELRIMSKTGRDIEGLSSKPHEREVLSKPRTQLLVTRKELVTVPGKVNFDGTVGPSTTKWVIHAEEITPDHPKWMSPEEVDQRIEEQRARTRGADDVRANHFADALDPLGLHQGKETEPTEIAEDRRPEMYEPADGWGSLDRPSPSLPTPALHHDTVASEESDGTPQRQRRLLDEIAPRLEGVNRKFYESDPAYQNNGAESVLAYEHRMAHDSQAVADPSPEGSDPAAQRDALRSQLGGEWTNHNSLADAVDSARDLPIGSRTALSVEHTDPGPPPTQKHSVLLALSTEHGVALVDPAGNRLATVPDSTSSVQSLPYHTGDGPVHPDSHAARAESGPSAIEQALNGPPKSDTPPAPAPPDTSIADRLGGGDTAPDYSGSPDQQPDTSSRLDGPPPGNHDWSPLAQATNPPSEPAIHAGTANPDQDARYVAENHPELAAVNPHFTDRDAWANGYQTNCTNGVVAYMQRMVGTDATADPIRPERLHELGTLDRVQDALGGTFEPHRDYDSVIRTMRDAPPGSHAVVAVQYADSSGQLRGHVAVVTNTPHGVAFIDPQTGGLMNLPHPPHRLDLLPVDLNQVANRTTGGTDARTPAADTQPPTGEPASDTRPSDPERPDTPGQPERAETGADTRTPAHQPGPTTSDTDAPTSESDHTAADSDGTPGTPQPTDRAPGTDSPNTQERPASETSGTPGQPDRTTPDTDPTGSPQQSDATRTPTTSEPDRIAPAPDATSEPARTPADADATRSPDTDRTAADTSPAPDTGRAEYTTSDTRTTDTTGGLDRTAADSDTTRTPDTTRPAERSTPEADPSRTSDTTGRPESTTPKPTERSTPETDATRSSDTTSRPEHSTSDANRAPDTPRPTERPAPEADTSRTSDPTGRPEHTTARTPDTTKPSERPTSEADATRASDSSDRAAERPPASPEQQQPVSYGSAPESDGTRPTPAQAVDAARQAAAQTRTDTGAVDPDAAAELINSLPTLPDASEESIRQLASTVFDGEVTLEPIGGRDGRVRTERPVYRVLVDGEPVGVVKVVPDADEFASEMSAADQLHNAQLNNFTVPDVLAVASVPGPDGDRRGVLFSSLAPGTSVDAMLRRVPLSWDRDGAMRDLHDAVTGVARGMAELHRGSDQRATPDYLAPHADAIREHLERLEARRAILDERGIDLDEIRAAVDRTLDAAAADPGPASLAHGDAHLGNFLWDPDAGTSIIDAPTMHQSMDSTGAPTGSPARDVALFDQRIGHFGHEFGLTRSEINQLRTAFAETYQRNGGPATPPHVRAMFDARAAMHRLARAVERFENRPEPRREPDIGAAAAALQDALGLDSTTSNEVANGFAGELPGTPEFRRSWVAIDNFRSYMERTADPQTRARFEAELAGRIADLQARQTAAFKSLWKDLFPSKSNEYALSPDGAARAERLIQGFTDEARGLLDDLASFANSTGDPDLAEGRAEGTIDREGTEAWEAGFREVQAKIDKVLSEFNYRGNPIGYIGSMQTGWRGAHKGKTRFDPNDFDVDLYVVVDQATFDEIVTNNPMLDADADKIMPDGTRPRDIARLGAQIGAALKEAFPHVKGIEESVIAIRAVQPW
ncbi:toxin glutamine deamidase domain-containing protein [Actinokineospora sp. NPDC004072]